MNIEFCQQIRQPPHIVFPWIVVPEKAAVWQPDLKQWEIITQSSGVVGTVFKEVLEEDGRTLELKGMVTAYQSHRLLSFHLESKLHAVDIDYALEPISQGTQVRVSADIRWKFPMSLICLFLGHVMRRKLLNKLRLEVSALKSVCESSEMPPSLIE